MVDVQPMQGDQQQMQQRTNQKQDHGNEFSSSNSTDRAQCSLNEENGYRVHAVHDEFAGRNTFLMEPIYINEKSGESIYANECPEEHIYDPIQDSLARLGYEIT